MKNTLTTTALTLAAGLLLAAPANAQDPMELPDDTWISISGTAVAPTTDSFLLDYGDGLVTVEVDDGDFDADAMTIADGDKVTVYGEIDDDFFEASSIEASSVYIEDLNTYIYASSMDEEDAMVTYSTPIVLSQTIVRGTVTETSDEEFVIDTVGGELRVEVEELPYDPMDDVGYQQIDVGDRVSVVGYMDSDLFEGRELVAESVVTLSN